jgi:hypothetical protein
MIRFFITISFTLCTSQILLSQITYMCSYEDQYLSIYKQVVSDDQFKEVLDEYRARDTIYIARDMNIFNTDKIFEHNDEGKTICIFSPKRMFMSPIDCFIGIKIIKWDNKLEVHMKTCSIGIRNINYYRVKIIFEKEEQLWVKKRYQIKKFIPTKGNICAFGL